MSLRDILIFGFIAVAVPLALAHPFYGALAWVLFGVMNPHRLTWGVAYDFPFALIIAIATLLGLFLTKDHRKLKGGAPGVVLVIFTVWMTVTLGFSFNFDPAFEYWQRVIKIFLMTGVLMFVMNTRRHIDLLVWTLVLSLGFYGLKGGIFVVATGGEFMVNGPDGSVMEGNNSLAVGLIIIIPLMVYLFQQTKAKWIRIGLVAAIVLCTVSVLGSYSRGALLAIGAMAVFLLWRSAYKLPIAIAGFFFVMLAIPAMPEHWTERMQTIGTYEEDVSAMGRINAWTTAYNIAVDKFPIGGGFEWEGPEAAAIYSPVKQVLVTHSIYFEVLAAQGFVGLALFLLFWWLVWRQCVWIRRQSQKEVSLHWAFTLASMTQVSMVGYAVGGAFLNLAFWDLPYYLYAAVTVTRYVLEQQMASEKRPVLKRGVPASAVDVPARGYSG